jgi:ribonuclease R
MHSAARLSYDEVWNILSGRDAQAARKRGPLVPHLNHLYELYRVLAKARVARGAIDFDTVETKIVVDTAGRIEKIVPRVRNDAHKLIEECMLAANVCAADFVHRGKHPALFRVHEGPTPEKLSTLRNFLRTLGLSLGVQGDPAPGDYARLSEKIRERPDAPLLQTMLLRSMQQAVYSPDNAGHFGLAYEAYAHFTSPIRRFPDLLTHRVIKSLIQGKRHEPVIADEADAAAAPLRRTRAASATQSAAPDRAAVADSWQRLGLICSANERRADDASRDVEAWLKSQYMRNHVGEQFSGRITGVATFGIFVTLDSLYVEGLVHVSELGTDYFQYSETSHELRGERTGVRYRLTDPIEVQVARVDLEARRIEFRLVAKRDTLRGLVEGAAPRLPRNQAEEIGAQVAAKPGKLAKAGKRVKGKPAAVAQVQAARKLAGAGRGGQRKATRAKT